MKKTKKRKVRLKTKVKRFFIYFAVILILGIYGSIEISKAIKEIKYQDTYEYKINNLGYSIEDTNRLINLLSNEKLDIMIAKNEYNEIYPNLFKQKYFIEKNFEKYIEYKTYHENTSYEEVIAIINVHANEGWYNVSYNTDLSQGFALLVNKFYHLEEDYERVDLENINLAYSYANNKAASIVIEQFKKMHDDIKDELNVNLMVNSSYRPYKDQEEIYESYKKISLKYADSYAARPGYSEHQTGLALDITSLEHKSQSEFKESVEYQWLKDNCYKYGFILRYPEGKENITGYNTESWHFRYVGNDIAKKIYDENITLDEYYAYYIAQ